MRDLFYLTNYQLKQLLSFNERKKVISFASVNFDLNYGSYNSLHQLALCSTELRINLSYADAISLPHNENKIENSVTKIITLTLENEKIDTI